MLWHLYHAKAFAFWIEEVDASWATAVNIALLIDLHAVGLARAVADGFGEEATVGERAVGLHIEDADVAKLGVVDVEQSLIEREAEAVGAIEVVNE